jgi:hypothetical protein
MNGSSMALLHPVIFSRTLGMKIGPSSITKTLIGLAMISCVTLVDHAFANTPKKPIIGWIETVQIQPENLFLSAKIDTGADHSSLNVTDPMKFTKGEKKWIRFTIPLEDDESVTLERPIKRFTRIKRKQGASLKRAVILLDLCVGTIFRKNVPVNLADRTGFKYSMLIGRSFLKDSAIVDSALTFTQQPSCSKDSSQ